MEAPDATSLVALACDRPGGPWWPSRHSRRVSGPAQGFGTLLRPLGRLVRYVKKSTIVGTLPASPLPLTSLPDSKPGVPLQVIFNNRSRDLIDPRPPRGRTRDPHLPHRVPYGDLDWLLPLPRVTHRPSSAPGRSEHGPSNPLSVRHPGEGPRLAETVLPLQVNWLDSVLGFRVALVSTELWRGGRLAEAWWATLERCSWTCFFSTIRSERAVIVAKPKTTTSRNAHRVVKLLWGISWCFTCRNTGSTRFSSGRYGGRKSRSVPRVVKRCRARRNS